MALASLCRTYWYPLYAFARRQGYKSDDAADLTQGFFARAKEISATARGFTWGPNVNVAYQSYKDQFGRAVQREAPFTDALQAMQDATVADMEKAGFTVSTR